MYRLFNRRDLLASVAACAIVLSVSGWAPHGMATTRVLWKPVKTNGGGLVTHLNVADDGTKVCGTDVGGAYRFDGTAWVQLCTYARLQPLVWSGYRAQSGVADITIAPSDSNIIFLFQRDGQGRNKLYKTIDGGGNFTVTGYPQAVISSGSALDANSQLYRQIQGKLGIDPINPNVIYASNPDSNALRSVDGGASWAATTLPVGTIGSIGACCFTFDRSSAPIGGRTGTIWCVVYGDGVYRSLDAGETWTQMSSTLTTPSFGAACDSAGTFYLPNGASTRVISRYRASDGWVNIWAGGGSNNRYLIAAHPVTAGRIIAVENLGLTTKVSVDSGDTWTSYTKAQQTFTAGDSAWNAADINNGVAPSTSDIKFDPANTNDVWLLCGQGIIKMTYAGVAPSWAYLCNGTEELVISDLTHDTGKSLFITCWDEIGFSRNTATLDTVPSSHFLYPTVNPIVTGWQMVRDPQNLNYSVLLSNMASACGYSTDDLATFHTFVLPAAITVFTPYPSIAVNNGVIIAVQAGSSSQFPQISTDNGQTWNPVVVSADIPVSGNTGWQTSIQTPKLLIVADKVDPNTFYMSNGLVQTPAIRGLWRTTNANLGASATWSRMADSPYVNASFNFTLLKAVPGQQGHLFGTCGHTTPTAPAVPPSSGSFFYYTQDGGATWTAVPGVLNVNAFGFGKSLSVGGYPTVFFAGFYKGTYGIYRMVNGDASTIAQLRSSNNDPWPLGINDSVTALEGDKDRYGRVYGGFEGCGVAYADAA